MMVTGRNEKLPRAYGRILTAFALDCASDFWSSAGLVRPDFSSVMEACAEAGDDACRYWTYP